MQTRRRPAGEDRAAAGIRLRRRVLVAKTALVALAGVVAEPGGRPLAPPPAPRPTAAPALAPTAGPPLASPLVIANATFIDGTGAPPVPAAALLIEGDRLRRVVV